MTEPLGRACYLLALSSAERGDLSAAARLAAAAAVSLGTAQGVVAQGAAANGGAGSPGAAEAAHGGAAPQEAAQTGAMPAGAAQGVAAPDAMASGVAAPDAAPAANARRLLGLCLYELGDTENAAGILAAFPDLAREAREACERERDGLAETGRLARLGKWRAALRTAEKIPHQSARLLNIRGCILAGAGRYAMAGRLFAMAAEKDAGGRAAREYLAEAARQKQSLWRMR